MPELGAAPTRRLRPRMHRETASPRLAALPLKSSPEPRKPREQPAVRPTPQKQSGTKFPIRTTIVPVRAPYSQIPALSP